MSSLSRTLALTAIAFAVLTTSSLAVEVSIRPGFVIVKLKPQAAGTMGQAKSAMATGLKSLDQLNVRYNIADMKRLIPPVASSLAAAAATRDVYGLSRFYMVELEPGTDVLTAVADYSADPNVELAEPDYIVSMDLVPNDPEYVDQWTHFNSQDRDIDTQEAWDLETGDSTVIVGVIDSGLQHDHIDLYNNVWVNPGEDLDGDGVPWDADDMNGLDDDGNSLIDDLIGYDFMPSTGGCWAGEDCNGPDNNPADFAGHGTHVNGIIAAVTGNGTGVAGIAGGNRALRRGGVKLMGLRAGYLRSDGQGLVIMSACAQAADYAVAKGAMGLNCSWGSSGVTIQTAIQNAIANGLVVCKAAGNDNVDAPDILCNTAGVLAVASLESNGLKSDFSNFGSWVDIAAPGGNILSTYSNLGIADYAFLSGTSMASPTVLGVAALLKSHHNWFTNDELDTLLLYYVDDIYGQQPSQFGLLGNGRVNADSSMSILTTADYDIDTGFGFAPLTVNFTNTSPNAVAPYLYDFGDLGNSTSPDVAHIYTEPGIYSVQFTGDGPSGPHTRTNPNQVVVVRDTIEYGDTTGLSIGQNFSVPVRLHNTHPMTSIKLPFKLNGPADIRLDSLTLTALTANWSNARVLSGNTQSAWLLQASTNGEPIPVGGGLIAHCWMHVVSGSGGDVETVDSGTVGISQHTLNLTSEFANFKPRFIGGSATIGGSCVCTCHGDPQCDGAIDVLDVVKVVGVAFRNIADDVDPGCSHIGRADMNCDCAIDVLDVVEVVGRAFRNDTSTPCDACVEICP